MNEKRNHSASIAGFIGCAVMAVSALLFFMLTGPRTAIHWWGLGFILGAELLAAVGIALTMSISRVGGVSRPMLLAGGHAMLILYAAASVLCSVIFLYFMPRSVVGLIVVQAVLLAMMAAFAALLLRFALRAFESVEKTMNAAETLQALCARAQSAVQGAAGKPYTTELEQLHEALRFTDHATLTATDETLAGRFDQLEHLLQTDADEAVIRAQVAVMLDLVAQRTAEVRRGKLGSV